MSQMKKVCVLLSGGADSTTLLYYLLDRKAEVLPLTVLYGQRHSKELESAKKVASHLRLPLAVADLRSAGFLFQGSALTSDKVGVPEGHYTDESMAMTVVPGRNLVFLALAGAYAISSKADSVAYAAHAGDHPIYRDCRPEFMAYVQKALSSGYNIDLITPFSQMTKSEVVRLGLRLSVPFVDTWSCYEGGARPCLQCGTCVERTEAFYRAGIKDPAITSSEWEKAVSYLRELTK